MVGVHESGYTSFGFVNLAPALEDRSRLDSCSHETQMCIWSKNTVREMGLFSGRGFGVQWCDEVDTGRVRWRNI